MALLDDLIQALQQLDEQQQQQLLQYARIMANTPKLHGESGESIVKAVGFFEAEALNEIEAAIDDADRIDWRGWE